MLPPAGISKPMLADPAPVAVVENVTRGELLCTVTCTPPDGAVPPGRSA